MFRKNCYSCNRPSFSSTKEGQWLCPVCGEDLTRQKVHHPEKMGHLMRMNNMQCCEKKQVIKYR